MTREEVADILRIVLDKLTATETTEDATIEPVVPTQLVQPVQQSNSDSSSLMLPAPAGSIITSNNPVPGLIQEQQREIETLKQQLNVLYAQQSGFAGVLNFNPIQVKGTLQ